MEAHFSAQQSITFIKDHFSTEEVSANPYGVDQFEKALRMRKMALAWLTIALSENHLLVYCLQEAFSMPEFIKSWDPWINMLWINKAEVIEALKAVYT